MELNKRDFRAIIYYEFCKGSNAAHCTKNICKYLGDEVVNERTVFRWYKKW